MGPFLRGAVCCLGLVCSGCVVVPARVAPPPAAVAAHPAPPPEPECREFQQTIVIGGRLEQAYGTSCQQPDGSWRISSPRDYPRPPQHVAVAPPPPPPAYVGYRGPYLVVPVEPPSDNSEYHK